MSVQEEERNKAIVHEMVEALNKADWAVIEQHPGLYETRQRMPLLREAFPDLEFVIEAILADGDLVGVRGHGHATHKGSFMGVAPTNKELTFGLVMIDQLADGKIIQHNAIPDWLSLFVQLGVVKPL